MPENPFVDEAGRAGGVEFWQSGPIVLKVGVTCGVMFIVSGAVVAHCPASGVKVYCAFPTVEVLMVAGFHVPVIPLVEVTCRAGGVEFWQSGPIVLNVGVICGVMVTVSGAVVAHSPAPGVKVYWVFPAVEVPMVAGFQVPVIPLVEVVGKAGGVEF